MALRFALFGLVACLSSADVEIESRPGSCSFDQVSGDSRCSAHGHASSLRFAQFCLDLYLFVRFLACPRLPFPMHFLGLFVSHRFLCREEAKRTAGDISGCLGLAEFGRLRKPVCLWIILESSGHIHTCRHNVKGLCAKQQEWLHFLFIHNFFNWVSIFWG